MTARPPGDGGRPPESPDPHVQYLENAIAELQRQVGARASAAGAGEDKPRARSARRAAIADWAAAAIAAALFALALYLVSEARRSSDAAAVSAARALESSGAAQDAAGDAAGSANSARESLGAAQDAAGDAESSRESVRATATAAQAAKSHAEASAVSARESSEAAGGAAERTASWTDSARAAAASARAAESRALASAHASSEERRTTARDIESLEGEIRRRIDTRVSGLQTELNRVKQLSESVAGYSMDVEVCFYSLKNSTGRRDRSVKRIYDLGRKDDVAILNRMLETIEETPIGLGLHRDIDSQNWMIQTIGFYDTIHVKIVFVRGISHRNYRDGGSKIERDNTYMINMRENPRPTRINARRCSL